MSGNEPTEVQAEKAGIEHSEVLVDSNLMGDAFDAENREHEMSTWQAVKSHPWACLWAFTMCFTIVSLYDTSPGLPPIILVSSGHQLMFIRSWNRSTCS